MAITRCSGVDRNITPLMTIGGASWPLPTPVENIHAGRSWPTLAGVIWSSGL